MFFFHRIWSTPDEAEERLAVEIPDHDSRQVGNPAAAHIARARAAGQLQRRNKPGGQAVDEQHWPQRHPPAAVEHLAGDEFFQRLFHRYGTRTINEIQGVRTGRVRT